jgi:predicted nucleotidyltransferase
MIATDRLRIPEQQLVELCRRYDVLELALFGSVLREDYGNDSDIDVLVEFEADAPNDLNLYARLSL